MAPKLPVAPRPFRIFALPLARLPPAPSAIKPAPSPLSAAPPSTPADSVPASTSTSTSSKTPLLLFHTSQPDPAPTPGQSNYANKALAKASETWLKLGEKPKKSWTYWFYAKGEKLMDRIEYEEWALKAVKENAGVKISKEGKIEGDKIEIPLLRPEIKGTTLPPLLPKLHRMLLHRIPYHRKMMYRSLIFTPATAPFAIIPVIPNFPFFYVLWRAWSHYKAWRGALYLETLLKNGLIVEKEDRTLSEVYADKAASTSSTRANHAPDETHTQGKIEELTEEGDKQDLRGDQAKGMAPQAKGETEGAVDGTSTPASMVHTGSASASTSASSDSKATGASEHKTGTLDQPLPAPAPGPITSKAQHPSLLLSPGQIPNLARTFDLRPNEVVDITRAVEQADFRARKADKEKADKEKAKVSEGASSEGKK
ncbi:hypothetical protein IAU60_006512 [Kwoniella sp. DSM 27419]